MTNKTHHVDNYPTEPKSSSLGAPDNHPIEPKPGSLGARTRRHGGGPGGIYRARHNRNLEWRKTKVQISGNQCQSAVNELSKGGEEHLLPLHLVGERPVEEFDHG